MSTLVVPVSILSMQQSEYVQISTMRCNLENSRRGWCSQWAIACRTGKRSHSLEACSSKYDVKKPPLAPIGCDHPIDSIFSLQLYHPIGPMTQVTL